MPAPCGHQFAGPADLPAKASLMYPGLQLAKSHSGITVPQRQFYRRKVLIKYCLVNISCNKGYIIEEVGVVIGYTEFFNKCADVFIYRVSVGNVFFYRFSPDIPA